MSDESTSDISSHCVKMPKGIPYILTNEAAERFSFYGMRCILTIFMTQFLMGKSGELAVFTPEKAKEIFHYFVAAVYFTPLLGAILSDVWFGKFRTIVIFSLVNSLGFFVLAFYPTQAGLYIGLALVALGAGVIKPCVSANVGDQLSRSNQDLLAKVYSWFYFSINLGAFSAQLLTPELLDRLGPKVAFGAPAVAMLIATLAFWLGGRCFVHVPPAGTRFLKEAFSGEGLKIMLRLAVLYVFVAMFWSIYDQMDSAWVLQAENMNRNVLGYTIKSSQLVTVNPFAILVLIPTFSYVIYPAINRVFPLTALRKISMGLFFTTLPFVVSALVEMKIVVGQQPTIMWLFLAHILIAAAEVMVSITALEFSYAQAPKTMKSFIMAVFFLSLTLGNLFTGLVNRFIQNDNGTSLLAGPRYFWFFSGAMLVTAFLFVPAAYFYPVKNHIRDEETD
ncbi:POT family MFS transporter [Planctomycetota bacterium]